MPRSEDFDRSQVLQNAKEVFWVKGYNGTSMQDLVDATGLNRSSIYNSFGNKMELFQQTLKQYQDESAQLFDNACAQNKNAIETIGLTFLYSLKNIKEDTDNRGCMFINCGTELGNQEPAVNRLWEANQEQLVAHFQSLVVQGQQEGSVRSGENPENLAHYLASAFVGFRITGMHTKDMGVLKSIIQNTLKTIT